jgi:Ca-activated chloride channel family protein
MLNSPRNGRTGVGQAVRFAFAAAAFTMLAAASASAAERVILVLDASGSMAGKINGERKIDIAKDAVESLLRKFPRGTEIGLMAYGHRRKNDCSDIQMIAPISKPNHRAMMIAVDELRPIGKTPLGQSVLQAAKKLNFTEEKATVILVSDGKENCGIDPCQLGRELKKQGINFRAHVIGFNLRRGQDAGLRCLANNTGGIYVEAKDAPALNQALKVTVEKASKPEPKPEPKIEKPKLAPGVKVRTLIKAGGPEFNGDIGITIYGPPEGLEGKRKKLASVWRKRSGYIFKGLKPGEYLMNVVLADHRHIAKNQKLVVGETAAQIEDVVLNIGQVRFDYSLSEGGKPFTWDVGWTVYGKPQGLDGKRPKIASFWRKKSGTIFWLPAGKWLVNGLLADARYMQVSQTIEVEPGSANRHAFNFNGGLVRFDAKLSEEGAGFKGDLAWDVYGKPKGLEGKRPKIANFWRKKSGNIFVLPAGEWALHGMLADHRHVKLVTKVKVEPGSEELHVFNFNAGVIRFDVTVGGQKTGDDLGLTVFEMKQDLSGKRKKIANFWRKKSGHIAILSAGEYFLSGLLADQRKTVGTTTFKVEAGDEKPVALDLARQ